VPLPTPSTKLRVAPAAKTNRNAAELDRLHVQVHCGCALLIAGYFGFRVAMEVCSGPSVPLGLALSAGIGVVTLLTFSCLPDPARTAFAYLVGLFLH